MWLNCIKHMFCFNLRSAYTTNSTEIMFASLNKYMGFVMHVALIDFTLRKCIKSKFNLLRDLENAVTLIEGMF